MKKRILAGLLTAIMMLSLCACGEKELTPSETRDAYKETMEEVTLSQAIDNGRTLWYYTQADEVAKDETFSLYIFENGKVAYYGETDVTFGDLNGLSDDEIIKLVDEATKKSFEEKVAEETDLQTRIRDNNAKIEGDPNPPEKNLQVLENLTYSSPESASYQLKIITDDTGNNTKEQKITYQWTRLALTNGSQEVSNVGYGNPADQESSITLSASSHQYTIYDMEFGGFATPDGKRVFLTRVDYVAMFALDAPNTAGIETD